MRAACAALDSERSLEGRRVVIQGVGHVGSHLARMLVADGAHVSVSDIVNARAVTLARELDIVIVAHEI